LDKTVSFYAEDASYFPSGAPVVVGKDAIRKAWADFLAIPGMRLNTVTRRVDVARSGDLAYEVGSWEMTINDKDGKPVNSKGKYVVVWKKHAGGDWKAVVDIDNSDQ
jgi:ketosteroid isomerase-like protein